MKITVGAMRYRELEGFAKSMSTYDADHDQEIVDMKVAGIPVRVSPLMAPGEIRIEYTPSGENGWIGQLAAGLADLRRGE